MVSFNALAGNIIPTRNAIQMLREPTTNMNAHITPSAKGGRIRAATGGVNWLSKNRSATAIIGMVIKPVRRLIVVLFRKYRTGDHSGRKT